VVGREELQRYGDSSLSGALKRQPGLSIAASGEIRLRGLGAGYIQILIDGEPAPSGFAIDTLSPDLVERIEIQRSAQADASAQAVAGSINIVMRKSAGPARRSLKLGAERQAGATSPAATLQWTGRGSIASYGLNATLNDTRRP
jgi:outer membrane receptor for ferrienterochelin and colicin